MYDFILAVVAVDIDDSCGVGFALIGAGAELGTDDASPDGIADGDSDCGCPLLGGTALGMNDGTAPDGTSEVGASDSGI